MEIENPLKNTVPKQKILIEIAWETCNQVGGIYTVIRTKVPSMVEKWGDDYFLIGPYFPQTASAEFEPIHDLDDSVLGKTVQKMRSMGFGVHYGYWLVTGKPRIILFDFWSILENINKIKATLWERHKVSTLHAEELVNHVLAFGEMVRIFLTELASERGNKTDVIAHFHEWMASSAIPDLRQDNVRVATVFTTHATMLGRYLAGNVPNFYEKLHEFDWLKEAKHYGIEAQATIERLAAQMAHSMTTVSDVTARECEHLLGKVPDLILPNGLNITRFSAMHEHQNLHTKFKDRINEFVMGHFFQSQPFDLDKTLYFFTSGRYEFSNKGYDLTLEALSRLNWKMKNAKIDKTVVMFFITKQPYHSIDPEVLHSRAVMDEIRQTCSSIEKQIGDQLFGASASSNDLQMPDLNNFVDEYWRLRLRRTIQTWKNNKRPKVVTHLLKNSDGITDFLQKTNLMNNPEDRVKIVYHPDFVVSTNPLFGMDYGQFVRGCNLGVFPSYYEPWGYTPLECIARGVPTITSDLSGFGDYMMQIMKDYDQWGVMVVNRKTQDFYKAAEQLSEMLLKFVKQGLRERISQRNRVESISETFDWNNLRTYYDTAHDLALKRRK
jgi:glycogen(starch) synthase